jgi:hypothetical protein
MIHMLHEVWKHRMLSCFERILDAEDESSRNKYFVSFNIVLTSHSLRPMAMLLLACIMALCPQYKGWSYLNYCHYLYVQCQHWNECLYNCLFYSLAYIIFKTEEEVESLVNETNNYHVRGETLRLWYAGDKGKGTICHLCIATY